MLQNGNVQCVRTQDKQILRSLFERIPAESLYLWADLSEPFFSQCEWFAATQDGETDAVVIVFSGLGEPSLQSVGSAEGVRELLETFVPELPARGWFKAPVEHVAVWKRWFDLSGEEECIAMVLPRDQAVAAAQGTFHRWSPSDDVSPLQRIYEDYPGNFFQPSGLEGNVYLTLMNSGEHVCVAGTHTMSRDEQLAVLGNITTAASHRGNGYATQCVSALIGELRGMGIETIGLHVIADNTAAIRCYEKLGFETTARLVQARVERVHIE